MKNSTNTIIVVIVTTLAFLLLIGGVTVLTLKPISNLFPPRENIQLSGTTSKDWLDSVEHRLKQHGYVIPTGKPTKSSGRLAVYRLTQGDKHYFAKVYVKPLTSINTTRMKNETEILSKSDGSFAPTLVEQITDPQFEILIMTDEGEPVAEWIKQASYKMLSRFLDHVNTMRIRLAKEIGYIHNDLHDKNIVRDGAGTIRLIDFDLVKEYTGDKSMIDKEASQLVRLIRHVSVSPQEKERLSDQIKSYSKK